MPEQERAVEGTMSMTPYTGAWTKEEAAHLLRRTMFGPTKQQISDTVSNGMSATVTAMLQIPIISDPVSFHPDETIAAFGSTWVNSVYPTDPQDAQLVDDARQRSLASWMMERLNKEQFSISEKMCLFWQNHFAAESGFDARATYDYHMLIHSHALGNFKTLVKEMTINPNMLMFLNGSSNNVYSPNENYSRELLELFTIGKGPQVGTGDYTNYKEHDVAQGAKILTGYSIEGIRSDTLTSVTPVFNILLHDTTTKTLSNRFANAIIVNGAGNEYSNYIDVIFLQNEVARYICRKLYRYFVNYELTTAVETNVITEMASTMVASNYEVLPVLQELFTSEHFYDIAIRGSIIRSPLDMMFSMFNATETTADFNLLTNSNMQLELYYLAQLLGQSYAEPPSVAGWPVYYQEPSFTRLWINSTTFKNRFDISDWLTKYDGIEENGDYLKIDALTFVDNLPNSNSAIWVINDTVDVFFPKSISQTLKDILKGILTNGQPDFEWTMQYDDYVNNPGNATYADPVRIRVEQLLSTVFKMPQFHVM